MVREPADDNRDEQEIFATLEATYPLAGEVEQRAMVEQLRSHLPTIPADRRMALIDAIERAIGENVEWQEQDF